MNFIFINKKNNEIFSFKIIKGFPDKFNYNNLYIDGAQIFTLNNNKYIYSNNVSNINKNTIFNNKFPLNDSYLIIISCNEIIFMSNLFSILPIYIYNYENDLIISSSLSLILKFKKVSLNKKYILQSNLFNYSLFDETIFKEIKIIPSNTYISYNGKINKYSFKPIEDYYKNSPVSWNKAIDRLVEKFIAVNENKIKNGDYISFTSGFDGRCLVAMAKFLNKEIQTYSFGTEKNVDLTIPKDQAAKLGIDFYGINLDSDFYYKQYWDIGSKIIKESGGATNFLQVHWPYSAKLLSQKTGRIIMGIFGSEIFRAAHNVGQFVSQALFDYFENIETDRWINKIKKVDSLKFLNKENFRKEMDELIDELSDYKKKIIHLNPNQRFYKYIFDEIFRKFFGLQIILPQMKYLNLITPYLDFEFIKELLKTELAGVHNDFFTHNPLKRFRGQVFYSKLIQKTYPEILNLETGKGYKPKDLLKSWGKVNIAYNFLKKRLLRNVGKINLDNLGIISAYEINKSKFDAITINDEFFDTKIIDEYRKNGLWKNNIIERDKFIETLSLNFYLAGTYEKNIFID